MKSVFLSILLITGLLAGLSSCKKDNADPVLPPPVTKIQEYKNGEEFIRFQYNTDGTVKKATVKSELNTGGEVTDYTINYTADKKIASLTTATGKKIEPEYENNVLIRANIFQGNERQAYTNYRYENGLLQSATLYTRIQGVDYQPAFAFMFTYNTAGNTTETVAMIADGTPGRLVRSGHVAMEYDQKTNPLYEHNDLLALFWQAASKNNITSENHFDANLVLENKYTYAYTYKPNGLPEHATVTISLPGRPSTTSNIDFLYQ